MAEESVIKEVFPNDVHANLQGKQVVKTMNTPWLAQWIGELGQIQQSNTKCSHYVTHSVSER